MEVSDFLGIAYDESTMDCADFVVLVQKKLFGRDILFAGKRPRPDSKDGRVAALNGYTQQIADRVSEPQNGDGVLMKEPGQRYAGHIGTFFFLSYTPMVLHNSYTMGSSRLHKVSDLRSLGLTVEGYYRWKSAATNPPP